MALFGFFPNSTALIITTILITLPLLIEGIEA